MKFVEVLLIVPHVLALLILDDAGEFDLVSIDCNNDSSCCPLEGCGRDEIGFGLELRGEVVKEATDLRGGGTLGVLSDNISARLGFDRGIDLELD